MHALDRQCRHKRSGNLKRNLGKLDKKCLYMDDNTTSLKEDLENSNPGGLDHSLSPNTTPSHKITSYAYPRKCTARNHGSILQHLRNIPKTTPPFSLPENSIDQHLL